MIVKGEVQGAVRYRDRHGRPRCVLFLCRDGGALWRCTLRGRKIARAHAAGLLAPGAVVEVKGGDRPRVFRVTSIRAAEAAT